MFRSQIARHISGISSTGFMHVRLRLVHLKATKEANALGWILVYAININDVSERVFNVRKVGDDV